jgi:sec-independent protein translocase protein TatB
MFDIGFLELIVIAVIALVVIGPKRLPETIRTIGLWVGRAKRAMNRAYQEMDRELGLDDIRRQLHNEEVMRSLEEHKKRLEAEILGKSRSETGNKGQDSVTDEVTAPSEASASVEPTAAIDPKAETAQPTESGSPDATSTTADDSRTHKKSTGHE